jgi:hypothetical protein
MACDIQKVGRPGSLPLVEIPYSWKGIDITGERLMCSSQFGVEIRRVGERR